MSSTLQSAVEGLGTSFSFPRSLQNANLLGPESTLAGHIFGCWVIQQPEQIAVIIPMDQ